MSIELNVAAGNMLGQCHQAPLEFHPWAQRPRNTSYLRCKAVIEFIAAAVLLVLTAPLVLLAAVLTKLTSAGPAFYSQIRLGRYGRPYTIYKIRTMYYQCERVSGAMWSAPSDPRVTPVGRFLRSTHVDELPQLWNVLRGDMSLVGPRPERPEFVPLLARALPHYRERLLVRPGVTGLAQVQLPADTDLESVRRKLAYDLCYVRLMSPWLDFRIILSTLLTVTGVPFAVVRKLCFIPSAEQVDFLGYQELTAQHPPIPQMQPTQ
jgi:lipopolysaccharide/colanic/teichoic acid biosynthesis glycosyltransferase